MKTLWMDLFLIRTNNAVHRPSARHQTGQWDRLAFKRSAQEVA